MYLLVNITPFHFLCMAGEMKKKDPIAMWSFGLGLLSIGVSSWAIMVPLFAFIFGCIGIGYTKEKGTGRWMAVTGLILGVLYLLVSAYNNGYFGHLTHEKSHNTEVVGFESEMKQNEGRETRLQATSSVITGKVVEIDLKERRYIIRATNISDQTLKAYKGTYCVRDSFGTEHYCDDLFPRFDPLAPNESFDSPGYFMGVSDFSIFMVQVKDYDNVFVDIYDTQVLLD